MSRADERSPLRESRPPLLTTRQGQVLRAVVASYVGCAAPVGSDTVCAVLPVALSSASVRNTLAELSELGLVSKPHASAGRVPTSRGFRAYLDQLLEASELGAYEQRSVDERLGSGAGLRVSEAVSRLLSERTRQVGFYLAPRLEGVVLRHVSFVRVSSERVMALLITRGGAAYQRLLEEPGRGDQAALDRMAAAVNARVAGRTLRELRELMVREAASLHSEADRLLERVLRLEPGATGEAVDGELVIATRVALLDQPEFRDPGRLRALLAALEERDQLVRVLDELLEGGGLRVLVGEELEDPGLQECALVVAPYGAPGSPLGAIGVIGPRRMDYGRIIPLVRYVSGWVSQALSA